MNKNLKKAISTVAALALTASSIGVVSAATKFTDVEGTPYASAISQLSAMGIVDGFEDGSFKPDEGVNRAQFAKLVAGAMNQLTMAEANTTVIFDDVKPGSFDWAIGYVAQAYQAGIVNGTNDAGTTFTPDKGVTYAEAMKMLVCAAGYEAWSLNAGGWPNGYLQYANNVGIGAGVTGVSNDTALTRGQCAQMIANAMTAAICEVTGYDTDNGQQVPKREQQDGTNGRPFKSLLTENWDAYEVNGHVSGTKESGATDAGKVNYVIQKTKNYDEAEVKLGGDTTNLTGVYDDTNEASSTLNQYTRAIIKIDDNTDEEHILYIELAGRNVEQELDANNWSKLDFDGTKEGTIEFYKSSSSSTTTSYKLSKEAQMLVNNVEVPLTEANCEKYLENNADVKCTLVDTPANGGTTDGKYDYVIVDYAAVAVVDEITTKTNEIRVNFDTMDSVVKDAFLKVEVDDEDKIYSFVYDGNEIKVEDLQQYDVLNLVFDPNASGVNGSDFVKATVTRNVVEGVCTATGKDSDGDEYYTVGGTNYYLSNACTDKLEVSNTYKLYLDANNDIAKVEESQNAVNYAIVDRFYTTAGDKMVRLITKTGEKKAYVVKEDKTGLQAEMKENVQYYDSADKDHPDRAVKPIEERIVDYSINSSNEVTLKSLVQTTRDDNAEYKAATTRVGSTFVSDANNILNASMYADKPTQTVTKADTSYFINEMTYAVVFAGKRSTTDGSYPFVVIVEGNDGYTVETKMAVYQSSGSTQDDGQDKDVMYVYVNGENAEREDGTTAVLCEQGTVSGANLTEGDAIVYSTNSDGYVDNIVKITKMSTEDIANYRVDALKLARFTGNKYPFACDAITDAAKAINFKGDGEVSFVLAPVIERSSNSVTVAELGKGTSMGTNQSSDAGKVFTYDNAFVYNYEGNGRSGNYITVTTASGVAKSSTPGEGKNKETGIITWDAEGNTVNYALLRLVDDDVKDVLSISEADNAYNKAGSPSLKAYESAHQGTTPVATEAPTPAPTQEAAPAGITDSVEA